MNFNQEKYKQLCKTCNSILVEFSNNISVSSHPWLNVLNEHPTTLEKYSSLWKERGVIKNLLRKEIVFFIFYLFFKLIFSIFSFPLYNQKKKSRPKKEVIFLSHLFKQDQIEEKEDFYFGKMPHLLNKFEITSQIIFQNHLRIPTFFFKKKIIEKSEGQKTMLDEPSFSIYLLSLIELVKAHLQIKNQISKHTEFFVKRVLKEASIRTFSIDFYKALIFNHQIKKFLTQINPKIIITTLEGHPREKMLFFHARELDRKTLCIGYQHTILFPKQNSIFHYPNTNYMPNMIFTPGKINNEVMLRSFSQDKKIQIVNVGSHRIYKHKKSKEPKRLNKNCLILPDGNLEDLKKFSQFISQINDKDLNFIIRLHPAFSLLELQKKYKLFLNCPRNISFSEEKDINEDFKKSSWAVYRGSGAIIYAIQNGLRPIYLRPLDESLSIDPLYKISKGKKIISTYLDLKNIINLDKGLSISELNRQLEEIKRYNFDFFEPLNFPKILSKFKKYL